MSAITAEQPLHETVEDAHHPKESFFRKYIWTYDHKMIGIQYLWTALFFLFLGGGLALLVRYQLAWPNTPVPVIGHLLPATVAADGAIIPGGYNMLVTMHATVMVFFVVVLVQMLLSVCLCLASRLCSAKRPGPRPRFPERWLLFRLVI